MRASDRADAQRAERNGAAGPRGLHRGAARGIGGTGAPPGAAAKFSTAWNRIPTEPEAEAEAATKAISLYLATLDQRLDDLATPASSVRPQAMGMLVRKP